MQKNTRDESLGHKTMDIYLKRIGQRSQMVRRSMAAAPLRTGGNSETRNPCERNLILSRNSGTRARRLSRRRWSSSPFARTWDARTPLLSPLALTGGPQPTAAATAGTIFVNNTPVILLVRRFQER